VKLLAVAFLAFLAFGASDNPAPVAPAPTTEPAAHANPGFTPGWACNSTDDTTGVKGRIRAVPVDPSDPECK